MAERYHIFHSWNSTVVLPFFAPSHQGLKQS